MRLEQDAGQPGAIAPHRISGARLGIGLLQGLMAWCLLELAPSYSVLDGQRHDAPTWAQLHPAVFATLALWTAFIPVIALVELSRMRSRRLVVYLVAVAAGLAALVGYDLWRMPLESTLWQGAAVRIWPSADLAFCAGFGLFIINQLLEHRTQGFRLFTNYAAHFEDGWMRGFQLVLSLIFTLLVWGVLELGKGLFDLIHVEWFGHMIEHNWFRSPVLAMAFAGSVHLTDIRPVVLRGMRTLGLTLLSWLLPLVVVLGCGFLVALLFTGLSPLWSTRFAAWILLWAVTVTLLYLNAAYNDGDPAHRPVVALRWTGRVAGPMMLVLAVLAAYAIGLRVGQHGWTPQRVRSAAVALVAVVYGGGYTWATLSNGPWLRPLERVNVVASLLILAILIALFSPLADPARLSVDSQMARLSAAEVSADQFDYQFLHFDAGRYGTDALASLAHSKKADVAQRARLALATKERSFQIKGEVDPATTEPALSHVSTFPAGSKLPSDFVAGNIETDRNDFSVPGCLRNGQACDIVLWKGGLQGSPLLIVLPKLPENRSAPAMAAGAPKPVYGRRDDGKWVQVGQINRLDCPATLDDLRGGRARSVAPAYSDLQVGDVRLRFTPIETAETRCPAPIPGPAKPRHSDARAPSHMGPAFGSPGAM